MKQSELIKLIANDTGITYETVRRIIRKTTKYIGVAVENNDTVTLGVGTFTTYLRGPKPVTNFVTGVRYLMEPTYKLRFTPSAYLKGIVARKNRLNKLEETVTTNDNDDDGLDEEE